MCCRTGLSVFLSFTPKTCARRRIRRKESCSALSCRTSGSFTVQENKWIVESRRQRGLSGGSNKGSVPQHRAVLTVCVIFFLSFSSSPNYTALLLYQYLVATLPPTPTAWVYICFCLCHRCLLSVFTLGEECNTTVHLIGDSFAISPSIGAVAACAFHNVLLVRVVCTEVCQWVASFVFHNAVLARAIGKVC